MVSCPKEVIISIKINGSTRLILENTLVMNRFNTPNGSSLFDRHVFFYYSVPVSLSIKGDTSFENHAFLRSSYGFIIFVFGTLITCYFLCPNDSLSTRNTNNE